jgi:hypothetical protein
VADAGLVALRNTLGAKREQLAALREQASRAEKDRALTEQAEEFDRQRDRMKAEADRLTQALAALDAYRRRMAEDLPIPGLSIEGKEIRVNGVPYDQLNMQARIDIAVKVAMLRAKGQKLPVIFVDGAEALDTRAFRRPRRAARRCKHTAFGVHTDVTFLADVGRFTADIRIECAQCKEPFRFLGLDAGWSPYVPSVSATGLELRVPIEPQGTPQIASGAQFVMPPLPPKSDS